MLLVEIPEFPRLRGEKAIEALYDFVDELKEQRGEELTDKQTAALIKFAWGLISSIEVEIGSEIDFEEIWFENKGPKVEKVTLDLLKDFEILSDTEGIHIFDLAEKLGYTSSACA